MNLVEFFSESTRRALYRTWLEDPMTQQVLSVLEEHTRPMNMGDTSDPSGSWSEKALYHHGINVGQSSLLKLVKTLDQSFDAVKKRSGNRVPQPKYDTTPQP